MADSRIALVTGGPGFIGRRVALRLLNEGWKVRSFSLPGEGAPPEWGGRAELTFGDIGDPASLAKPSEGVGLIIHLAAIVGVAGEYERQWRIIAEGTRVVCEAAARAGARLLVASSIAVYGDKIQTQVCREDDGHGAWQGAYGRAKQAQETIARDCCAELGVPLTLIRPANVFGLGGASAWGDRYLEFIRATGGAVIGAGEANNAGLTFVENLADAITLAATLPAAIGRTFNVCDGEDVSWRRFNDDMAAVLGMPPPPALPLEPLWEAACKNEDPANLVGPRDPTLPLLEGLNLIGFDNRIDAERIQAELGWRPRISYHEAMMEIAKAYSARSA